MLKDMSSEKWYDERSLISLHMLLVEECSAPALWNLLISTSNTTYLVNNRYATTPCVQLYICCLWRQYKLQMICTVESICTSMTEVNVGVEICLKIQWLCVPHRVYVSGPGTRWQPGGFEHRMHAHNGTCILVDADDCVFLTPNRMFCVNLGSSSCAHEQQGATEWRWMSSRKRPSDFTTWIQRKC